VATSFIEKLEAFRNVRHTDIGLLLAPHLSMMPLPIQGYDDPFFPFGRAIVDATRDLVCMYMFDLASYLLLGAAGAIALERTIAYASRDVLTILHGPFVGQGYAGVMDESAFAVDGVTLADGQYLDVYVQRLDRGALIVRTGDSIILDAPDTGGFYWQGAQLITLPGSDDQTLRLRLAVLKDIQGEDFTERVRGELERMRER
jgi:hypothetical protein